MRGTLERFAPTVVMASLDEGYLDFTGTERLHPVSLLPVAEAVRDTVRADAGLDVSIGIGPNRMVAKLASDAAKPRGSWRCAPGWEEGFLAGLPLRALPGIGPDDGTTAGGSWACSDVWQVQQMAEARARRASSATRRRLLKLRAHGWGGTVLRSDRPATLREPRDDLRPRRARPRRARDDAAALRHARVEPAARRAARWRAPSRSSCGTTTSTTVTRSATLREATDLDRDLFEAVRPLFVEAFGDACRQRNRGVRLIGVSATNLTRASAPDLFEAPQRERLRQLSRGGGPGAGEVRRRCDGAGGDPGTEEVVSVRPYFLGLPCSAVVSRKSRSSKRSRTTPDARFTCGPRPSKVATRPLGRIARTLLLRNRG